MPGEVTRGEFDLLRTMVTQTQARVEGLDAVGTKGVAVVQAQLVDLAKDVVRLEADMGKRFDAHDRVHKDEAQARVSSRRWVIGITIAGFTALGGILSVVIEILIHLHGG